jgi:hypothetical protein
VGDAGSEEPSFMKHTIQNCPGDYEVREITHTVKHQGRIVIIDHVPTDVLLKPETVRHIEALLRDAAKPARSVPLYEYA